MPLADDALVFCLTVAAGDDAEQGVGAWAFAYFDNELLRYRTFKPVE